MSDILKKENGRQPANFGSIVDQIFQNNLARFFDDSAWGFNGNVHGANIPVNIRETGSSYELELIAPGLQKEDFTVNVAGDTLTVAFEHGKDYAASGAEERWIQQQFRKQPFSRSFQLSDMVEATNITARYENGILYLSLPKNERSKRISKAIQIA